MAEQDHIGGPPPKPATRMQRYCVLDIETVPIAVGDHLPPRQDIREVGACEVTVGPDGTHEVTRRLSKLVRGDNRPTSGLGATSEGDSRTTSESNAAAGLVSCREALMELTKFCADMPVVAHGGQSHDFRVLDAACERHGVARLGPDRLDTVELAHLVAPRIGHGVLPNRDGSMPPTSRSLDDLAIWLGLADAPRSRHRALPDAELTATVIEHMSARLEMGDPARQLQRRILHAGSHPWARLLAPPSRGIRLIDCLRDEGQGSESADDAAADAPDNNRVTPHAVDMSTDGTRLLNEDEVLAPLSPGGSLVSGPGRAYRPQQQRMAAAVLKALTTRRSSDPPAWEQAQGHLAVEAPTGTGKTMAYLVPAVACAQALRRPVAIATHSKVLQDQLLTDIERYRRNVGAVRWVMLKGLANYASVEYLDAAIESGPDGPAEALGLAVIAGWAAQTTTGDWDDLSISQLEASHRPISPLKTRLTMDEARDFPTDELDRYCFFRRALDGIESCDIVVANHAVLVTREALAEKVSCIVIDEGHNLEDAATNALTETTSSLTIAALLDNIENDETGRGALGRYARAVGSSADAEALAAARTARDRCRTALRELQAPLVGFVRDHTVVTDEQAAIFGVSYRLRPGLGTDRPKFVPVSRAARALSVELRTLAECMALAMPAKAPSLLFHRHVEAELGRISRAATAVARILTDTTSARDDDRWISIIDLSYSDPEESKPGRWEWSMRRVPLSVTAQLRSIWDGMDSVVLTSATLRAAGNFSHVLDRIGLHDALPLPLPTPFDDLASNEMLVLPRHLPTPRGGLMAEFTKAEADEIARLLILARGRTLALFTASARMSHARDHLRRLPQLQTHGLTVLCQGDAPSGELVGRMRAGTSASLLATRSFWEGVDVPGEALSLLIIEKLPFAGIGDPVVAARMDELRRIGEDPFNGYLVPEAALRFIQAVGRLVRTESDKGVCVVLDKRIRTAPYASAFLDTLPGPPRIERPQSADRAYGLIAQHLALPYDEDVEHALGALPSSDRWQQIAVLGDEQSGPPNSAEVDARLEQARSLLGFNQWRPGQLEVMRSFLAGHDTLAVMPTGAGKSLTYQVPAMLRPGLTLVVSPLVALMRDQVESLRERGLTRVAELRSGQPQAEQAEVLRRARDGAYKLLYVSPERLWSSRLRQALADVEISAVAIDEAHCISQWGHAFRPNYRAIAAAVREMTGPARPPILAVTATGTKKVTNDIVDSLDMGDDHRRLSLDPDRAELRYYVEDCDSKEDRDVVVLKVAEAFRGRPAIVYVPSRAATARLAALLRLENHTAFAYHGGMDDAQRVHVEEAFRSGEIDIVVGTNAFGLGIDKPDVEVVVHLEMPSSIESYVQEVGRAARGARDGTGPAVGHCILLWARRDCGIHDKFISDAAPEIALVRTLWEWLSCAETGGPVTLTHLVGKESEDAEKVSLAAQLLVEQRCVSREEDMIEEGVVRLLPGADEALRSLDADGGRPDLTQDMRRVVDVLPAAGERAFSTRPWARELGLSYRCLEAALIAMDQAEIVALSAWQIAPLWRRLPGTTPDFDAIERLLKSRRLAVLRLSESAKSYRSNRDRCRRLVLLEYLGTQSAARCESCDVCRPQLQRPWQEASITRSRIEQALDTERLIVSIVGEVKPGDPNRRAPSRRNIERCLAGESGEGDRNELPLPLRTHSLYGRLTALGQRGVKREVNRLIRAQKLRSERVLGDRGSWEILHIVP